MISFRTPGPPPLKVLKPTVSSESFWNHSNKKWSDINISLHSKCFKAFLDVFSTKNSYQKTQKIRTPGTPPSLFRTKFKILPIFCVPPLCKEDQTWGLSLRSFDDEIINAPGIIRLHNPLVKKWAWEKWNGRIPFFSNRLHALNETRKKRS